MKSKWGEKFEESSLRVKNDLKEGNRTLDKTFGLDEKDFLQKVEQYQLFLKMQEWLQE